MSGFNKNRFIKQEFEHRTESVSVPALAAWFDKGSNPEWTLRNISGNEMALAHEALAKSKNVAALAEALLTSNQKDKVEALKQFVGTADDVPGEMAKRLEMLVAGSVDPEIDMPIAIKLADNFPVEFMMLSNKVIALTGLGASQVKPKPSGKTRQSRGV